MSDISIQGPSGNGVGGAPKYYRLQPEADIYESDDAYLIMLDVPGADSESFGVELLGNEVRVKASRVAPELDDDAAQAEFRRTVELPGEVDPESVSAELTRGVLSITLGKSQRARRRSVPITVN